MLDVKPLADELEELRAKIEVWKEYSPEEKEDNASEEPDADEIDREKELTALEDELGDLHRFARNGGCLIPDGDFEDYARELAEDIGERDAFSKWPHTCIDWERAASELLHDYSSVDFEGETYHYQEP